MPQLPGNEFYQTWHHVIHVEHDVAVGSYTTPRTWCQWKVGHRVHRRRAAAAASLTTLSCITVMPLVWNRPAPNGLLAALAWPPHPSWPGARLEPQSPEQPEQPEQRMST